MNPTSYLFGDHGLHVLKPRSFPLNRALKMRKRHQLFFGLRLVRKEFQHPQSKPKYSAALWRMFSSTKSASSGSELCSLFKFSRVKLENQKPIPVDFVFKAYPLVPFPCTVYPILPDGTFNEE
jgi:hypothetical protein